MEDRFRFEDGGSRMGDGGWRIEEAGRGRRRHQEGRNVEDDEEDKGEAEAGEGGCMRSRQGEEAGGG